MPLGAWRLFGPAMDEQAKSPRKRVGRADFQGQITGDQTKGRQVIDPSQYRLYAARSCATLGAGFLVLAALLASLEPVDRQAMQVLSELDPGLPGRVQADFLAWFGRGLWVDAALPLLVRPIWLVPLLIALLLAGGAISLAPPGAAAGRRRS